MITTKRLNEQQNKEVANEKREIEIKLTNGNKTIILKHILKTNSGSEIDECISQYTGILKEFLYVKSTTIQDKKQQDNAIMSIDAKALADTTNVVTSVATDETSIIPETPQFTQHELSLLKMIDLSIFDVSCHDCKPNKALMDFIHTRWSRKVLSDKLNAPSVIVSSMSFVGQTCLFMVHYDSIKSLYCVTISTPTGKMICLIKSTCVKSECKRKVQSMLLAKLLFKDEQTKNAAIIHSLLLQCGDVETNPGPVTTNGFYFTTTSVWAFVSGTLNATVLPDSLTVGKVLEITGGLSSANYDPANALTSYGIYAIYRSSTGPYVINADIPDTDDFAVVGASVMSAGARGPSSVVINIPSTKLLLPRGYSIYFSSHTGGSSPDAAYLSLNIKYDNFVIDTAPKTFTELVPTIQFSLEIKESEVVQVTEPFSVQNTPYTHYRVDTSATSQLDEPILVSCVVFGLPVPTNPSDMIDLNADYIYLDGTGQKVFPLPSLYQPVIFFVSGVNEDLIIGSIKIKLLRSGDVEKNPGPSQGRLGRINRVSVSHTNEITQITNSSDMLIRNDNKLEILDDVYGLPPDTETTETRNEEDTSERVQSKETVEGVKDQVTQNADLNSDNSDLSNEEESRTLNKLRHCFEEEFTVVSVQKWRQKKLALRKEKPTDIEATVSICYAKTLCSISFFKSVNHFDVLMSRVGEPEVRMNTDVDLVENELEDEIKINMGGGKRKGKDEKDGKVKKKGDETKNGKTDSGVITDKQQNKKEDKTECTPEEKRKTNQKQREAVLKRVARGIELAANHGFGIHYELDTPQNDRVCINYLCYIHGVKKLDRVFAYDLAKELKINSDKVKFTIELLAKIAYDDEHFWAIPKLMTIFASLKDFAKRPTLDTFMKFVEVDMDTKIETEVKELTANNSGYLEAQAKSANSRMHALNGNTSYHMPDQTFIFPAKLSDVKVTKSVEDMMNHSNAVGGPDMSTWYGMLSFSSVMSNNAPVNQNLNSTQYKAFTVQDTNQVANYAMQFPVSSWYPLEIRDGEGGDLVEQPFGRPVLIGGMVAGTFGYELLPTAVKDEVQKGGAAAITNLGRPNSISGAGFPSTVLLDMTAWDAPNICMDLPALKMVQLLHVLEYTPNATLTFGKTHEASLMDPYTLPGNSGISAATIFGGGRAIFNEDCTGDPDNIPVSPYGYDVEVQFHVTTTSIASEAGDRWIAVPTWVQNMFPGELTGLGPLLLAMCFAPKSYVASGYAVTTSSTGTFEAKQGFCSYADCVYLPGEDRINMLFAKSAGSPIPYTQNQANQNLYAMPRLGSSPITVNGLVIPAFSVMQMSYNTNLNATVPQPVYNGRPLTMAQWIYSYKNDITAVRVRNFLSRLGMATPMTNSLIKASFAAGWLFSAVRRPIATPRNIYPPVYDRTLQDVYESTLPNGYGRLIISKAFPLAIFSFPIDFMYPACEPSAWDLIATNMYYVAGISDFDKVNTVNALNITTYIAQLPIQLSDSRMLYHTSFEGLKIATTYSVLWAKMGYGAKDLFESRDSIVNGALAEWSNNLKYNIDSGEFLCSDFNFGVKALYCSLWDCAFPSLINTGVEAWFGDCLTYPNYFIGGVVTTNIAETDDYAFVPQLISDGFIQLVVNYVPRMMMGWSSPYSAEKGAANICLENPAMSASSAIMGNIPNQLISNLDFDFQKNINTYSTDKLYWQDDSTIWNFRILTATILTSINFRTYFNSATVIVPSNTLVYNQATFTLYYPNQPYPESICALSCIYPRIREQVRPIFLVHNINTPAGQTMVQALQGTASLRPPSIIAGDARQTSVNYTSSSIDKSANTVGTNLRPGKNGKQKGQNSKAISDGQVSVVVTDLRDLKA